MSPKSILNVDLQVFRFLLQILEKKEPVPNFRLNMQVLV